MSAIKIHYPPVLLSLVTGLSVAVVECLQLDFFLSATLSVGQQPKKVGILPIANLESFTLR